MNKFYLSFTVFLLLAVSGHVSGQLSVTAGAAMNMTPLQLVQTQLVGQGITVSNATYNGSSASISSSQIGFFGATNGAYTELGLAAGVLLTSGCAVNAIGPNNTCGKTCSTGSGSDPDLVQLVSPPVGPPKTVNDKCVLEFDFVPQADTLKFRYVFGSEEF